MLLLHLSDLHFGPHSRFAGEDLTRLGKAFQRDLEQAKKHFGLNGKVDLVVVTGDVAESGKPKEFELGAQFLTALAGELGLEHRRVVFVPGNHDISWLACKMVEAPQEEDEFDEAELRRRMDEVKLSRYEELLKQFYGVADLGEVALPLGRGAYLYDFPDLRLSVGALNSCERESHRRKDHLGSLSRQQAEALMGVWLTGDRAGWLKVVAVHHNPVVTVPANLASWRDYLLKTGTLEDELITRYEADVVGFEGKEHLRAVVADTQAQLVLHGHHHAKDEQPWPWKAGAMGYAHVLSAGSLTLKSDVLPQDEPLSFRLIEMDPEGGKLRACSLIFDVRARTKGEVRWGAFVPDPAEPDGYAQRLDLPPGFVKEPRKTVRKEKGKKTGPSAAFLRTYRQAFSQAFARWDLSVGIVQPGGAGQPIDATLDDMYQPLRLAEGFNIDRTDLGSPIDGEMLLGRDQPLAIRGAAGAGKTTWMRYTFRRLVGVERALPLMLVVRDLARRWQEPDCQGAKRSLDIFLDAWVSERLGEGWKGEMKRCLEAEDGPRPVLLVDGWDEAGRLGEELRESLLAFMTRHPRLLVVVTSRPYGSGKPSHSEGFEVLDVQPLSDAEIQQFARRFFLHCHGEDANAAAQDAERFWSALESAPEPRGLARTALLLTMILLISRSETIPDKRHLLYERCIDSLLTALPDRKANQGALLSYEQWRPEDSEQRKRVVAALAFALQEQGYKRASRSSIVSTWAEMSRLLPQDWPEPRRSGFLAWLAGPAGLLTDRADGTMTFTHLSFQEYLGAWHLHATIEGADDRSQAFIERKKDVDWWETLRLWAALIEKQSPERLEPVLEATLKNQGDGLAFVGTILADGLGTEERFLAWCQLLVDSLLEAWPDHLEQCARAWSASRQDARKSQLGGYLAAGGEDLRWLPWTRRRELMESASLLDVMPLPKRNLSRALAEVVSAGRVGGRDSIAAGRLLCGGPPIWPIEPLDVGLLQVWPGDRRLLGMKLQSAALAGASHSEMIKMVIVPSVTEHDDFARDFSRGLARDFFARDFFDRDLARDLARDFARDFLARDFFDRDLARDLARDFARVHSLNTDLNWLLEFAHVESRSGGRVGARVFLAQTERSEKSPLLSLLSEACRLSIKPTQNSTVFAQTVADLSPRLDPLWPALARHLARCSTPEDRALLISIAQHPEKREPPLSWGLQFIVRGDVLLEDGSIVTLDELTGRAGLPRLPYLEDLPDELEMDSEEAR